MYLLSSLEYLNTIYKKYLFEFISYIQFHASSESNKYKKSSFFAIMYPIKVAKITLAQSVYKDQTKDRKCTLLGINTWRCAFMHRIDSSISLLQRFAVSAQNIDAALRPAAKCSNKCKSCTSTRKNSRKNK